MTKDTYDIIVVGSGAGAMTAAIRAHDLGKSVLVIEKSPHYGGTSAMSGGGIWIPNHGKKSQVSDSKTEAFTYVRDLAEPSVTDERIHAYLDQAPQMLRYMEQYTHLKLDPQDSYCDYYPDKKGAKEGGRTLDPVPFSGRRLGSEFNRMREQHPQVLAMGRMGLTMQEGRKIFSKDKGWMGLMSKLMLKYWLDIPQRTKSKRDRRLVLGNALVGRLRKSMMDRKIDLCLSTPMTELLKENDRVVGIKAIRDGQAVTLMARDAVILGAGGFEKNQKMREQYLPQPSQVEWSAGNAFNTGDAIQAGQALGAKTDLMNHAWWGPAVVVPKQEMAQILFIEKSLPGVIFVNKHGERYGNEAAPYQDYGNVAYQQNPDGDSNVPAFAIFDAKYRHKYIFGPVIQGEYMPDERLSKKYKQGFLSKADTLDELAVKLDIQPDALSHTIGRFNEMANAGDDQDFQRGGNLHDRYYGDKHNGPNPCLAPLDKGPFYGVRVVPGDLGTKGGLLTNENAQVLNNDGGVIDGLYAIGNTSASVMGSSYPGAGSTLGPAMTFGYIAANTIAG